MPDTSSVTSCVTKSPIRQSGPEQGGGSMLWPLGPIIPEYPLKDLQLYAPRWVWPPSFKHTPAYDQLRESIKTSGVFRALLILPDGQVVDGQHRYSCATELGLEGVPVRIIDAALPLSDADQLALEDWAVYDAINRRHLTKAQVAAMLYDLLCGRSEVEAKLARLRNLKRGTKKSETPPDPSHRTVKELAVLADMSPSSVERAARIVRNAPPEIQEGLRSGKLTPGGAVRVIKDVHASQNGSGEATAGRDETSGVTPAGAKGAHGPETVSANGAATTKNAKPTPPRTASSPPVEQPSRFQDVAESFLESARALVRTARIWSHDVHERLFDALGDIDTTLQDGAAKVRERITHDQQARDARHAHARR